MSIRNLVIIDDEDGTALVLRDVFADAGYRVQLATSGAQGLTLIRAVPPSAILCDLMLPKDSGLAVYATLQGDARLRTIPFVLMSAAPNLGAWALPVPWVVKPFDLTALVALITSLIAAA